LKKKREWLYPPIKKLLKQLALLFFPTCRNIIPSCTGRTQGELIELEVLSQKSPDAHYVIEILTLGWELSEKSGKEQAELVVANDTLHPD
jgi:hypothetical protein